MSLPYKPSDGLGTPLGPPLLGNPFFESAIPPFPQTGPETPTSTLSGQRPAKRKRFEIEPESEDDAFYRLIPETPPAGYQPHLQAMDCDTPFPDFSASSALNGVLDFATNTATLSEQEIDDFVSFIQNEPDTPPAVFQVNPWEADLKDGTPISIVNKLEEINCSKKHFENQLDCLRYEQNQMLVPPPPTDFEKFNHEQSILLEECKVIKQELNHIINSVLLNPCHLVKLQSLEQDFDILQLRLQLYRNELHYMTNITPQTPGKCFATLIVKKQPFPKSIKQHTKATSALEDPTVVELIRAPKADCKPCALVKTEFILEDAAPTKRGGTKRNSFTVKNDQQKMDDNGIVRFTDLRFPHGTKLKPAQLRFAVEVQYAKHDGTLGKELLESNPTAPFIVMTNENQWESSEATLLKHDLFPGSMHETTWFRFANILQIHYLRATRQDPAKPTRSLSKFDLEYLHREKFNSKPTITQDDFEKFWDWFGKVMHKIRHQKPFIYLWLQGLIYGFLSKPEAERLLFRQPVGTFVARFSERRAGQIAIAFSKKDKNTGRVDIKHYLVDSSSTKTSPSLPDFFRDHENLLFLPKLRTEFHSPEGPIACIMAKDDALKEHYTKTTWNPLAGYVDSVR